MKIHPEAPQNALERAALGALSLFALSSGFRDAARTLEEQRRVRAAIVLSGAASAVLLPAAALSWSTRKVLRSLTDAPR